MYFKASLRKNPETGMHSGYYRLVESYRYHNDRICHRTMLNIGFLEELKADQLNIIQKILTDKVNNQGKAFFEYEAMQDSIIKHYVVFLRKQIICLYIGPYRNISVRIY